MRRGLGGNSCKGRSVQVEGSVSVRLRQASDTGSCSVSACDWGAQSRGQEAGALWMVVPGADEVFLCMSPCTV